MICKISAHNKYGFSLIEAVIYLALLAFFLGAGLAMAFYIADTADSNKEDVGAQAEGNFILRKIDWALTGAADVSVGAMSISITNSSLPPSENPLVFALNGSDLKFSRGSGEPQKLNSSGPPGEVSAISGAVFSEIPASGGKPKAVLIGFTLGGKEFKYVKYLRI